MKVCFLTVSSRIYDIWIRGRSLAGYEFGGREVGWMMQPVLD